jgi:hypothetical protein
VRLDYTASDPVRSALRNDLSRGSGVYFYHVESGGGRRVGRFTVVNFAQ